MLLKLGTDSGNKHGKWENEKLENKTYLEPLPYQQFHFQFSVLFRFFIFPFHAFIPALPIPRFSNTQRKTLCSYEQGNLTHLFWPPKYCIPQIVAKIIKLILNPSTISQSSTPDKSIIVARQNTLQVLALVAFSQVSVKEKGKKQEMKPLQ